MTVPLVSASISVQTFDASIKDATALTSAVQLVDHKIIVGVDEKFVYNPANISVSIGDTVTFEFHPKNHTATQSSFLNPCKPLHETSTSQIGFKSGL